MLARAGFRARTVIASRPQSAAAAAMPAARVEDATLVTRVAEALRQALAPAARIEHYAGEAILHGVTIRVAARDGVIVLSGAVQKSEVIARAQATAQGVAGVGKVESRLVTAGMMDFD
jgi:osmotically-inducible protein OsmY